MEEIYIRYRGRVQGPFTSEQVRVLSQRGQFTRMHEVSSDQLVWSRATNFPELFAVARVERRSESLGVDNAADVKVLTPAQQTTLWHYSTANGASPPLDLSQLQFLFQSGQLNLSTHVWTQGMPSWLPAEQVPAVSAGLHGRPADGHPAMVSSSSNMTVLVIIGGVAVLIAIVVICGCAGMLMISPG